MSGYQRRDGELPNGIPGALGRKEDRAKDKAGFPLCRWTTEVGGRLNPHAQQISPGGASDKNTHTQKKKIRGDTEELGWYYVTEVRAGEI